MNWYQVLMISFTTLPISGYGCMLFYNTINFLTATYNIKYLISGLNEKRIFLRKYRKFP